MGDYVAITSMPNVTVGSIPNVTVTSAPDTTVVPKATDITAAISGHVTVTTHGTAVPGPDIDTPNGVIIKALSTNTGIVYVGNDGANDVASTNGYELSNTDGPVLSQVSNLSELYFDSAVDGEGIAWFKL